LLAICALVAGATGCSDEASEVSDDGSTIDVGTTPDASATDADSDAGVDATVLPAPTWDQFEPLEGPAPRLTRRQFRNSIRDLVGPDVVIPPVTFNDIESGGFTAVGSGSATVSPRTAEDYESATLEIAGQMVSEELRAGFIPCTPTATADAVCAREVLEAFGLRAWRRPLDTEELDRLVGVATNAATVLDDFYEGMEYGISAILQSPYVLFRDELGSARSDGADGDPYYYDDFELASRLSYLVWNSTPDDELLTAAGEGLLMTDEGLAAQFDRLASSERAKEGVLEFFRQMYGLAQLEELTKDPNVFVPVSAEFGPTALRETEMFIESIVFGGADIHDLLISNRTFVDSRLAAHYGIPSPTADGFGEVFLPTEMGRRGLLGQASFLSIAAHPTTTSPTLRGKFIRERLLCQTIPAPPANVDTSIPEPDENARTLRERLSSHLENPDCATCHSLTDPIGLAFENYDGVGQWRAQDNGVEIDATGELDGVFFGDSWDLSQAIADRDEFSQCMVQSLVRYGTASVEGARQRVGNTVLRAEFEAAGYQFMPLLRAFVMSPAFRTAAPPSEALPNEEGEE
jgi:hypothetical protein